MRLYSCDKCGKIVEDYKNDIYKIVFRIVQFNNQKNLTAKALDGKHYCKECAEMELLEIERLLETKEVCADKEIMSSINTSLKQIANGQGVSSELACKFEEELKFQKSERLGK